MHADTATLLSAHLNRGCTENPYSKGYRLSLALLHLCQNSSHRAARSSPARDKPSRLGSSYLGRSKGTSAEMSSLSEYLHSAAITQNPGSKDTSFIWMQTTGQLMILKKTDLLKKVYLLMSQVAEI